MKKWIGIALILAVAAGGVYMKDLIFDRQTLERELVRLHVVGATDSEHDQSVKLAVRDAVLTSLNKMMDGIETAHQAKQYITEHLPQIQQVANDALTALGETRKAVVSFMKEEFPVREYDSFTLPSGVYDSLRIVIGEGEGKNWWCVVFPKMCLSATSKELKDTATGAGFSDQLTNTITGQPGYQFRFFLLDVLGKTQKLFR